MKKCAYCGRLSEDTAVTCLGCGTTLVSLPAPEIDPQLSDPVRSLVIVGSFDTTEQASLLATRLEAAGIEACIPEEYASQVFSNVIPLGGVTVRVAAKDCEAAKAIAAGKAETGLSATAGGALEGGVDTVRENMSDHGGKRPGKTLGYLVATGVVVVFVAMLASQYHQYEARALLHSGIDYARSGELDKAINDFSRAIRINPRYASAYHNRGYAYERKGEPDKAIMDLSEAIRLNPQDARAYVSRGRAYRMKGELEKALADLDISIGLAPQRPEGYANRAYVFLKRGDYDKALSDLDEALRLDPNDFSAHGNRGYAYQQKGELDKAISDLSESIRLQPTNSWAYGSR